MLPGAMMAAERSPIRIVGRYAVYNEIAAGGMATVHIGRLLGPVGFARTVAIKRLHPQFAKDPEFVSMFLDEARVAARVQHPNVIATIDVVATDGELFLIMDYVRGESLSKLVRAARRAGEPVPPRIAAGIMCGFLHGLHSAHEAKNERGEPLNLVHRDVSPQNVLVGADGIARVLDFGIAKAQGRIQVTRDGQIKGKLAYMPPEQLSGRELSRAVDIYASAVVVWETLTGERLFKGESEGETLAKILRDPVLPPSAIVRSLPRAFDAVLLKALSRDASKRHATARELALELERCAGVASSTEIGEWVERIAGPVLSAREEQIAEIESSSTAMRVSPSGRPEPDSDSEAELSAVPSGRAGTFLGVGPSSATLKAARKKLGPPTPVTALQIHTQVMAPPRGIAPPREEGTGSNVYSGSMALPVDRKLPGLAMVAGLLVLIAIVGVVIAGRFSATGDGEATAPAPSAAAPSAAVTAGPRPAPAAADVPPPPATGTPAEEPPEADETDEPEPPPARAPQKPSTSAAPAKQVPVQRAPAPPKPTRPKPSCDPPYTVDAQGHRRYKLECM
jgi:eukaryotic-like serine/threonine-protein kinase